MTKNSPQQDSSNICFFIYLFFFFLRKRRQKDAEMFLIKPLETYQHYILALLN